jgi:hypothetical protein
MTCLQARDRLAEFALDILPHKERRPLERHLGSCSVCAREMADMQQGLVGAAMALPAQAPPPSLEGKVVERVAEAAGWRHGGSRVRSRALLAAALAAAVLAASSLGWAFAMRHQAESLRSRVSHSSTMVQSLTALVESLRANGKVLNATLVSTGGGTFGGGPAFIVTLPNEPDLFVIQVVPPRAARGPFHVLLVERSGRSIAAGRLVRAGSGFYMLASSKGFGYFPQNLSQVRSVLVVDSAGRLVLTGTLRPYASS